MEECDNKILTTSYSITMTLPPLNIIIWKELRVLRGWSRIHDIDCNYSRAVLHIYLKEVPTQELVSRIQGFVESVLLGGSNEERAGRRRGTKRWLDQYPQVLY